MLQQFCKRGYVDRLPTSYFGELGHRRSYTLATRFAEFAIEWTFKIPSALPSRKVTWLAGKSTMHEDVFPIENGDFPIENGGFSNVMLRIQGCNLGHDDNAWWAWQFCLAFTYKTLPGREDKINPFCFPQNPFVLWNMCLQNLIL